MSKQTRYAIYARVSTQDKGQYLENQLPDLRQYIEDAGGVLWMEYSDEESGKKADRPGFHLMLQHAHQRKFDVLLFWSLKRFSREGSLATLNYLEELRLSGISFKSFTERFLDTTSPMGAGIVGLMAALAAQDLVLLSEQTRAGLRRTVANGTKLGRPTLSDDKVAKIQELAAAGKSIRVIAAETGVPKSTVHIYLKPT